MPALLGLDWQEWLTRATVFIVAAAPCALVISIPITLVAAIGTAGRKGILIKGGVHLENLAKIRVVALDKTGTLTSGELKVGEVESFPEGREDEVLSIALTLEAHSDVILFLLTQATIRLFPLRLTRNISHVPPLSTR